jgi:hypothetical protein
MDYLKTSVDIAGARITAGDLSIQDGVLHLDNLTAKHMTGEYHFNANLVNDPDRGLIVDPATLNMKLPLLGRFASGTIRDGALNLNNTMLDHLDDRINPIWKAKRIDLVGEKIEITFAKKI